MHNSHYLFVLLYCASRDQTEDHPIQIYLFPPISRCKTEFWWQLSCTFCDGDGTAPADFPIAHVRREPPLFRNRSVYEQLRACVPPGSHAQLQALENLHEKEYESETSDAGLRDLRDDLERVMGVESVRQWLVKATDECQFEELKGFSDFGYLVAVLDRIINKSVTTRDMVPCLSGERWVGDYDDDSPVLKFSYDGKSYAVEDPQRRTVRGWRDNRVRT